MTVNARYTEDDHEFRKDDPYARAKYDITLRWLASTPPGKVLYHVGCGSGLFNRMAVEAGYEVEAFEPDPAAFALAVADMPENCKVHQLGLEQIEGEGVADVVVMHDVLEHIEDEAGAVGHLRRLVKDDGRVILSVPAMPSLFGYHDRQLGHWRRYTRRSLRTALSPPFAFTRLRAFGMAFIPLTLVVSRLLDRAYPTTAVEGRGSLVSRAFDGFCRVEGRVPLPLGTSLLCDVTPRR
jgi:2-polyprenyl-3-methyl-5-hydroxy-6-metoxy-1,4-benzoquinol methylase